MAGLRILFFEEPDNPYYNMAFEEALFKARYYGVVDDTLRIWRNRNAIVLGYFTRLDEEVNVELARSLGSAIVRRFTGGGAVYHDMGNLNYTIVVKVPNTNMGPLDYIYGHLLYGMLRALKLLGVEPIIENTNDIIVHGRKVSGNASSFRGTTYILHGTLLLYTSPELIKRLFKIPWRIVRKKRISLVKYNVTNLERILGRRIEFSEAAKAVIEGFRSLLKADIYYGKPSDIELEIANILYNLKYSRKEWNLYRRYSTDPNIIEKEIMRIALKL